LHLCSPYPPFSLHRAAPLSLHRAAYGALPHHCAAHLLRECPYFASESTRLGFTPQFDRNKVMARKQHYGLYTRLGFDRREILPGIGEVIVCFYCGEPAPTIDHTYPVSALQGLLGSGLELPAERYLVPACSDCNSVLSSKVFPSLVARRQFVKRRIRERFKHLLESEPWSDEDLEELGPGLALHIRAAESERRRVQHRLYY